MSAGYSIGKSKAECKKIIYPISVLLPEKLIKLTNEKLSINTDYRKTFGSG
jgi:hypothetical protein